MSRNGGFSVKRTVCTAAAVALAASGLIAGAAHADQGPLVGPEYGNVQANAQASLTIHKFETGSLGGTPSAASDAGVTGSAVNNVPFVMYRINADLTTKEGWDLISGLNVPATACGADGAANFAAFGSTVTQKDAEKYEGTTTAGTVTIEAPVGAYLVCEKNAPDATNANGTKVDIVAKAAPFVVTLPRPDAATKKWIYKVHSYPKNTVIEAPSKSGQVQAKGIQTADGFQYTITAKVPSLLDNQHFKYFSILDQMPTELGKAKVASVTVDNETFDLNEEYTVDYTEDRDFLAVNFTSKGISDLRAKANKNIVVTLTATVETLPQAKIENVAYVAVDTTNVAPGVNPATPATSNGPGQAPSLKEQNVPALKVSNKTGSTWGDLKIKKYDAGNVDSGLDGAEFKVYWANDQVNCTDTAHDGNAISVNGKATFTTENGGDLTIAGLFLDSNDAVGTGETTPKNKACYVVEETKAPAGFVLPTDGTQKKAVWVNIGTSPTADWSLSNTKVTVPALPLTGASGRVLLMVGGLALVLGSMGFVMVLRKRNAEA
ncbi:SpaH/EbpB family LPXTG-anchored major pilin [Schaalia sp. Marseille-Q2122]|uniref:SpaH/EbpB family LPXTG-anchored major pilin n=1 Tax=Schaalia sp. Marseille-Q2122 TaxID=2736604 RepID=UPI00158C6B81|nr:SpaH/EbpB family LPXTG-anchored major pilin [Schaalia sp. Marseille-Q2122]